jgi:hypothetical protein
MKIPIISLLVLVGMAACQSEIRGADYRVDQQHDWPNEADAIHSIQGRGPIVQEFTPSIGALDVVEIWTQDFGLPQGNGVGATLEVLLREDTINGPVLATSAPLTLPDGWDGPSRFHFTNVVWLTPEARYALELRAITGDNWGVNSHGDLFPPTYSRGRYFVAGRPTDALDMWFRTGVRMPTPELVMEKEGLRWQGVPPLNYRIWTSINLQEWGEIGQLASTTTNYLFTNFARGKPKLFIRVSQP